MYKEKILPVKDWLMACFNIKKACIDENFKTNKFNIPIQIHANTKPSLPIHIALSSNKPYKINSAIINALGGLNNIETYHEIPNSRRIRLTLVNPSLINNTLLEELDVRMFIRIGKKIVHIIP